LFSILRKLRMTLTEFKATLAFEEPPNLSVPLLIALWYDAKGNWDKAHEISQSIHTARGSWVHAYLHRKEGDMSNAAYWYARAGRDLPMMRLEEEWEKIAGVLLSIC
jgi:hypothetical protein